MRTSNPVFQENYFYRSRSSSDTMTIEGTIKKTGLLVLITMASAIFIIAQGVNQELLENYYLYTGVSCVVGLVLFFTIYLSPNTAKFASPLYALVKGVLLGFITAIAEVYYPGVGTKAALLTMATFMSMLGLYRYRIIRVTDKLRSIIFAATGAILLVYIIDFVLHFFNNSVPYLHSTGPIGIGISLVIIGVAAFHLLLDFDFIEEAVASGAPKNMEWLGAFGILVTLIWLYIEFLKLLMKLNRRD